MDGRLDLGVGIFRVQRAKPLNALDLLILTLMETHAFLSAGLDQERNKKVIRGV